MSLSALAETFVAISKVWEGVFTEMDVYVRSSAWELLFWSGALELRPRTETHNNIESELVLYNRPKPSFSLFESGVGKGPGGSEPDWARDENWRPKIWLLVSETRFQLREKMLPKYKQMNGYPIMFIDKKLSTLFLSQFPWIIF